LLKLSERHDAIFLYRRPEPKKSHYFAEPAIPASKRGNSPSLEDFFRASPAMTLRRIRHLEFGAQLSAD